MPTLSVFPMNPLAASVKKGEIKARYFNPNELFGHVQIVCPGSEPVPEQLAQTTVGRARVEVLLSGWLDRMSWRQFPRLRRFLEEELERLLPAIRAARPDVIRSYSTQLQGWLAVQSAKRLCIPSVVSVHADLDRDVRQLLLRSGKLRAFGANKLLAMLVERDTLSGADLVICAYRFPVAYARRYGARRIEVVYNRVDLSRFTPQATRFDRPFTILSVGRLVGEKNHADLIKAMPMVDGILRIVGDGPLYGELSRLASRLGVGDRVSFERSVPHSLIHLEYQSAHAYASAIRMGGVAIPVLEAMACALPIVVPRPIWESEPEVVADLAIVVERNPAAFALALNRLKANPGLRREMGAKGRARARELDGSVMEAKERFLYEELLGA